MADDTATLRDTVVVDPKPESEPAKPEEPIVPQLIAQPSPEIAEIARVLSESGVTKDQLNDILQAPKALEALRYKVENDPKSFLQLLESTNPQAGERFLESMADTYVDRYGDRKPPTGTSGQPDPNQNELMRQVEQLREQTTRLLSKDQQREQAASMAAVRQRYDARIDDMLGMKEVKDMNFTSSEVKNLRARLSQELGADSSAVQRVNNGNFVDVPRVFQSLLQEKADDRKAAADATRQGRERVNSGAFWEFPNGPDSAFLSSLEKTIASDNDPNWGGTIEAFAKALERTSR
jgi:hypothetical protein